jgi:hypothetical protein
MPKPKNDETKDEFVSRCAGDELMNSDYPEKDQQLAVCYKLWDDAQKEKKSARMQGPMMDESHDDFMDRCMKNDGMMEDHPEDDDRKEACQMMWDGERKSASDGKTERRVFCNFELRTADDGKEKIVFYPAVFNSWSEDMWGMREIVAPGAFRNTISKDDIRALFNHDPNYVLGRNTSKTLILSEDSRGLRGELDPPDTTWAKDLLISLKRNDITQGSFAFNTIKDSWDYSNKGIVKRQLEEVKLYDVSIVTYPAYPETSVQVRSKIKELRKKPESIPDPVRQESELLGMRERLLKAIL